MQIFDIFYGSKFDVLGRNEIRVGLSGDLINDKKLLILINQFAPFEHFHNPYVLSYENTNYTPLF